MAISCKFLKGAPFFKIFVYPKKKIIIIHRSFLEQDRLAPSAVVKYLQGLWHEQRLLEQALLCSAQPAQLYRAGLNLIVRPDESQ